MCLVDAPTQSVPENEVAVLVIDDRRNATIGVVLDVLWRLLLVFIEVEVDGVVGQPELFEDDGDLPAQSFSAYPAPRQR